MSAHFFAITRFKNLELINFNSFLRFLSLRNCDILVFNDNGFESKDILEILFAMKREKEGEILLFTGVYINGQFHVAMIFIYRWHRANRYTFHEFMDFILSAGHSGVRTNQLRK